MATNTADVLVLGMGPGGESLAGQLAEAGLSVIGIESRLVGGECPYYGCVPSKMMIRAADALAEARRVSSLAGSATVQPDFGPVADRIRVEATTDWDDTVAVERFTGKGGQLVRGRGEVTGPRTIQVAGEELTAKRAIVLNNGTDPAVPPIDGLADTPYWTNREAVKTRVAPESLIVLGAGVIGLELAQAFARFGSTVDVVEMADQILPPEEPEAAEVVLETLAAEGIAVHTGVAAERVEHDGKAFTVRVGAQTLIAERLLVATGRVSDLAGLGLASIGVDTNSRFVSTDEYLRVRDGVYAIGDVTGRGAFTHMSMYQAAIAARHILGEQAHGAEYHAVPRVTFTDPEVGAVGLTERQARERGLRVHTATTQLASSARGWIHRAGNAGVIKLVVDADRGVLVGATSAGPSGGEMLSGLTVAVHAEVPVARLRQMIYAYPTFHRAIEDALGRLAG
ncbi:pyruvate/2-oxoglutarate dehydrogenase complex dihydrolipoamide dehydrogenase (E3) component [Tamaricihabitans halophyticus]|uniref:Pyruvate/2-oxoglutarate dehydrogenase complex dihydrolipoamide dehydrogenase (E3) component n=1 Tax=Tamaricihabitans halophyticus TaxID=1262583 RepID=A0A4R2QVZ9_9PSEU|nr:NAD(P)/FAD-dependent oxidoreductase [Tamaricihabitans halophyticus]TCP54270.1 pyruvate/2-oxoglutarate dehydrogenase complex dihydrolipoamide dehydrogenase (E3) component [Tamaricihabitans halophyticus]